MKNERSSSDLSPGAGQARANRESIRTAQGHGVPRRRPIALIALVSVILLGAGAAARPAGATFPNGNVFAGVGAGLIKQFSPTGTLISTLDTGSGSAEDTGMAFDQAGNLYATAFTVSNVFKFDSNGNLIGPFGSGYDAGHAESIVFDIYGNAYVGQPDGAKTVLKFSP